MGTVICEYLEEISLSSTMAMSYEGVLSYHVNRLPFSQIFECYETKEF